MATKLEVAARKKDGQFIIDDREDGVFRVNRATFIDQAIFEEERKRIFDKCWLYVGHESEIPDANDFVTRRVGGREIIFNRDRKGNVNVFLNTCPHRGAMVERRESGSAISFRCFYHGWAFNNNGTFGTKMQPGDYGPRFNEGGCANLPSAPRAAGYQGFWFLSFDPNVESLESYLGDSLDIFDLLSQHGPDGMEIIGTDQRYSIRANWKLLFENSFDGYHVGDTHQTYLEYLADVLGHDIQLDPQSRAINLRNGHSAIEGIGPWGRPVANWQPVWGEEIKPEMDAMRQELIDRLGEERGLRIAVKGRNTGIFPNLIINDIMSITVRTFTPLAPGLMEVNSWALGVKGETRAQRKRRLDNFLEFLGPGGFSTPDDVEALESAQRGYAAANEVGWNDISRGMLREEFFRSTDEEQMRCFWREWARRMED